MSKFVVAAEQLDEKKFIEYLDTQELGWWHWIGNFWLITNKTSTNITTRDLQEKVTELSSSPRNFVLEINGEAHPPWHGFGPNTPPQDMFEWLHNTWDSD
ncbi:hypothetical protein KW520_21545 [Vibrio fluvialis]|nr:hypothetical protein [Vibrio fluvialis]